MMHRLKLTILLMPAALLLVIGAYVYSLWIAEKGKAAEVPVEAVSMMMRDLLRFHEKRGGFPASLKELEGAVWDRKEREFMANGKGFRHRNYYYLYSRTGDHRFTLWAIPTGPSRDEAPSWFLAATHEFCRRWKGAALPIDQIDRVNSDPSITQLGVLGLIEQSRIEFGDQRKSANNGRAPFVETSGR
jgi:hypothetical protein